MWVIMLRERLIRGKIRQLMTVETQTFIKSDWSSSPPPREQYKLTIRPVEGQDESWLNQRSISSNIYNKSISISTW